MTTPTLCGIAGLALLLSMLLLTTTPLAQTSLHGDAGLGAALDELAAAAYPADGPGATVIVVRDGEVLHREAYGMAHLELAVPLQPEMSLRIGSLTKQFTGVAILMLAEEGKLSLSDPMTRFLPDYPAGDRVVTIEHLLGHTSGIANYTSMPEWLPTRRTDLSLFELIALFQDEPFDFEPGEQFSYSNSGYVLLGAIIEEASGMSYAEFVQTRIFDPLAMTASRYEDHSPIVPMRAAGYSRNSNGWFNAEYLSMTHPHAAGALSSTVDDLARWDAAISRGELLSPGSWERAFTPVNLSDGSSTAYGAGWITGRVGPHTTAEHGGGIDGFASYTMRVPDAGLFVAVLANADAPTTPPGAVALQLAARALGISLTEQEVSLDPNRLDEYTGLYRIDEGTTIAITRHGDVLISQRTGGGSFEIYPAGDDRFPFRQTDAVIQFKREDGRIVGLELIPRLGPASVAVLTDEPVEPPPAAVAVSEEVLDSYVGVYRLAPNFEISITRDGDVVHAQATGQPRLTLRAESETRFAVQEAALAVEFQLDNGRVTGLLLHQGGRATPAPRLP